MMRTISETIMAYVPSSANIAGTEIELAVLVTDVLGNTTKATMSGVTHDDGTVQRLQSGSPRTVCIEE